MASRWASCTCEGASEPRQGDRVPEPLREAQKQLAVTVAERIALALANLRLRDTLRSQSILDPLTGALQPPLHGGDARPPSSPAPRAAGAPSASSCWTSITSSRSMTPAGTTPAMRCCASWVACSWHGCAKAISRAATVAKGVRSDPAEVPLEFARRRAEGSGGGAATHVSHRGRIIGPITVSAGVAAFPEHGKTPAALVHAADSALYRAKSEGRDRVRVAEVDRAGHPCAPCHCGDGERPSSRLHEGITHWP